MTLLRRTLSETVFYPPHAPRSASALYVQTHHRLVYDLDSPCVVCGVRHSTLGSPANKVGAKALETHHALVEWAGQTEINWDKLAEDNPTLPSLVAIAQAFHAHLLANGELPPDYKLDATPFVDSTEQMIVACDVHHRSSGKGVHMISGPIWELQRYERGDWDFTGGGAIPAPVVAAIQRRLDVLGVAPEDDPNVIDQPVTTA